MRVKRPAGFFRPLRDQVLVREIPDEERIGSIVVPDVARTKPRRGEVVAVGPGKFFEELGARVPVDLKLGDVVHFSPQWPVYVPGHPGYAVIQEGDVACVEEVA